MIEHRVRWIEGKDGGRWAAPYGETGESENMRLIDRARIQNDATETAWQAYENRMLHLVAVQRKLAEGTGKALDLMMSAPSKLEILLIRTAIASAVERIDHRLRDQIDVLEERHAAAGPALAELRKWIGPDEDEDEDEDAGAERTAAPSPEPPEAVSDLSVAGAGESSAAAEPASEPSATGGEPPSSAAAEPEDGPPQGRGGKGGKGKP